MYSYTYRQSGAVGYATKKAGLFAITRKGILPVAILHKLTAWLVAHNS